jgi:hypothetical protein
MVGDHWNGHAVAALETHPVSLKRPFTADRLGSKPASGRTATVTSALLGMRNRYSLGKGHWGAARNMHKFTTRMEGCASR